MDWRDYIVSTPGIIKGKPRIRNTRIPVSLILGYLAAGNTIDDIIKEFSDLKRDDIIACIDYASDSSEFKPVA
jgi:uncharacterized protein (DUF433 family)